MLDPRTKVLLVIVTSSVVMAPAGRVFVIPGLVIAVGLALWESARMRALGIIAAAAGMWVLGWALPVWWPGPFTAMLSLAGVYLIGFVVAIGVGAHVFATTSPTALHAALRSWRAPRALAVTLVIVLRFVPIVAGESRAVVDAMRLRGLTGARGLLRHPVLSIERFIVPMIAASLRASEDCSSSAILRGLGAPNRPTALVPPRFGAPDAVLVGAVAALSAAALVLPSPLS